MIEDNSRNKLSLKIKGGGRGFSDITFGTSGFSGIGGVQKKTGAYSAGYNADVMSGNWTGWEGLHRVLDSATFADTNEISI